MSPLGIISTVVNIATGNGYNGAEGPALSMQLNDAFGIVKDGDRGYLIAGESWRWRSILPAQVAEAEANGSVMQSHIESERGSHICDTICASTYLRDISSTSVTPGTRSSRNGSEAAPML